jgi:hypothetical protein
VRSATVNLSFGVFPGSRSAPWDPTLDVGEDGIVDWRFDSSRGGALGLQDTFSDGGSTQSVRFETAGSSEFYVKLPLVGHAGTSLVIWTTTPWTLPANLAVAYNSTFSYSLVQVGEVAYIVSALLLSTVA